MPWSFRSPFQHTRSRVAYRLLGFILLFSALFTLLATGYQLVTLYRQGLKQIDTSLTFIRANYLPAICSSIYKVDHELTHLLLKTLLQIDFITRIQLVENVETHPLFIVGTPTTSPYKTETMPLIYALPTGGSLDLGTLTLEVTREKLIQQVKAQAATALWSNSFGIFLAATALYFLIQQLLTRHLATIARHTRNLDPQGLLSPLTLSRRPMPQNRTDELDQVVSAINAMQERLHREIEYIRKAEEELRLKSLLIGAYSQTSIDGILMVDLHGKIVHFNKRFKDMWNIPEKLAATGSDEVLIRHVASQLKHPRQFTEKVEEIYRSRSATSRDEIEFSDGRIFERHTAPITDPRGTHLGRMWAFRDITERKILEQQLQQAQKMEAVGTLAGGIAHDFNNLLTIILGNLEMIQEDLDPHHALNENAEEAITATLRARDVVKQLLRFSRISRPSLEPLNAVPLIMEVMKLIKASTPADIAISFHPHAPSEIIEADATQIHQVLLNLCTNAVQAMFDSGGELSIATHTYCPYPSIKGTHTPRLVISVTDTGPGVAEEIRDRIFDPYFTTKEVGEGSGMGLATARGIIEAHGGTIALHSPPQGGASFQITLPTVATPETKVPPDEVPIPAGTESILFVDDEWGIIRIADNLLSRLGYRVTTCQDPLEALELFKKTPNSFDLVITDITMPSMSGDTLARKIMELKPGTPVIACTGYSRKVSREEALQIGIASYIRKPLSQKEMARTVREVLDAARRE